MNTTKSISAGDLCKKLTRLLLVLEHTRNKVCMLSKTQMIQYPAGSAIESMLQAESATPEDELVQPGVCPPTY